MLHHLGWRLGLHEVRARYRVATPKESSGQGTRSPRGKFFQMKQQTSRSSLISSVTLWNRELRAEPQVVWNGRDERLSGEESPDSACAAVPGPAGPMEPWWTRANDQMPRREGKAAWKTRVNPSCAHRFPVCLGVSAFILKKSPGVVWG